MDELDRKILNRLQYGLPLTPRPFVALGEELNCSEAVLLQRIQNLLDDGILTRYGPLFDIEPLGGAFTLVALSVPEERFDEVAELLQTWPEVAHNYRRQHEYNMWLVLGCSSWEEISETLRRLEAETGLKPLDLPKEKTYHVGLHFNI